MKYQFTSIELTWEVKCYFTSTLPVYSKISIQCEGPRRRHLACVAPQNTSAIIFTNTISVLYTITITNNFLFIAFQICYSIWCIQYTFSNCVKYCNSIAFLSLCVFLYMSLFLYEWWQKQFSSQLFLSWLR